MLLRYVIFLALSELIVFLVEDSTTIFVWLVPPHGANITINSPCSQFGTAQHAAMDKRYPMNNAPTNANVFNVCCVFGVFGRL